MGHFAVFDLTESGEKIGRKLFALLTKTQQDKYVLRHCALCRLRRKAVLLHKQEL